MDYRLVVNMQLLNISMNIHFHAHTRRRICSSRDKQDMANFVVIDKYYFADRLSCGSYVYDPNLWGNLSQSFFLVLVVNSEYAPSLLLLVFH